MRSAGGNADHPDIRADPLRRVRLSLVAVPELAAVVAAPAPGCAVHIDRAGVEAPSRDRSEAHPTGDGRGQTLLPPRSADTELAAGVRPPAPGGAVLVERASVRRPGADVDVTD